MIVSPPYEGCLQWACSRKPRGEARGASFPAESARSVAQNREAWRGQPIERGSPQRRTPRSCLISPPGHRRDRSQWDFLACGGWYLWGQTWGEGRRDTGLGEDRIRLRADGESTRRGHLGCFLGPGTAGASREARLQGRPTKGLPFTSKGFPFPGGTGPAREFQAGGRQTNKFNT